MCLWFEINLRPDLDYKFDYDAAFWILFGGSSFAYMLCLVVPLGIREPLPKNVSRAITWGLDKNGSQSSDYERQVFKARSHNDAEEHVGKVGKVKAHPLEKLLSFGFVLSPLIMGLVAFETNNWNEIYPQRPTACLSDSVCLNGGRCILIDNWVNAFEDMEEPLPLNDRLAVRISNCVLLTSLLSVVLVLVAY